MRKDPRGGPFCCLDLSCAQLSPEPISLKVEETLLGSTNLGLQWIYRPWLLET
jgi:hypothetical protein